MGYKLLAIRMLVDFESERFIHEYTMYCNYLSLFNSVGFEGSKTFHHLVVPVIASPFPGMSINLDFGSGDSLTVLGVAKSYAIKLPASEFLIK